MFTHRQQAIRLGHLSDLTPHATAIPFARLQLFTESNVLHARRIVAILGVC